MKRKILKYTLYFILTFVVLNVCLTIRIANGIGSNFELDLKYEARLSVETSTVGISCNRTWIWPIDKVNTKGDHAFGTYADTKNIDLESEMVCTYFLFDMKNNDLQSFSEEGPWREELRKNDIDNPRLIHPSFYFNLLRGK